MTKQSILIVAFEMEIEDSTDWPLKEYLESLKRRILEVPQQYRERLRVRVSVTGDGNLRSLEAVYVRQETEAEEEARELDLSMRQLNFECRERLELERLKNKFENQEGYNRDFEADVERIRRVRSVRR